MRAVAWAARLVGVLGVFGGASPAAAQELPATTVLGMATEGADDSLVAENLTAVLRRAVEENRTVRHTGREATLAQMSLAFGCEDQREASCLMQIGQELQSRYLLSGSVQRTTRGGDWAFRVEAWVFDVQAGRELRTASAQFGRSRSDIDDLRDVARELVGRLLAGESGSLEILAEEDGAEVSVDGELAGEITDGGLLVRDLETGEHRIEVRAEGFDLFETTATVSAGSTARVRVRLVAVAGDGTPSPGRRRGGIGPLQWIGIGSLVAGAAMGVIAIAMAADVNATDSSAEWIEYRHRVRLIDPLATSACDAADSIEGREFDGEFGLYDFPEGPDWELGRDGEGKIWLPRGTDQNVDLTTAQVFYQGTRTGTPLNQDMIETVCAERTQQWILGGLAVAAGVVGTYLVFGTSAASSDEVEDTDPESVRLQLSPVLTREQRGLGLQLTF
jgi:hypothetical protein